MDRERDARGEEIERLKAKGGEITMANELYQSALGVTLEGFTNHGRVPGRGVGSCGED